MKKISIYLMCLVSAFVLFSCDYLDIVPDETPSESDAFEDEKAAERYMYGCYGMMQKERLLIRISGESIVTQDAMYNMALGNTYTASNPRYFNMWSRWYGVIRRCWLMIDNVDGVPNINPADVKYYKAEAKFLIAYHHFLLLRAYGPIIIADHAFDVSMSVEGMPARNKFDDCVDYICTLFDEAAADLPTEWKASSYGRATKAAALAFKAKTLVYAASPLFNGNSEFYSNFKDPSTGEPLMNLTYDATKWTKAAAACKVAVEAAEAAGKTLYYGQPNATYPQPSDPVEFRLRMNIIDPQTDEVIWADTRSEDYYDFQNSCTPRHPDYGDPSWNETAPTWRTVTMFYTENGLPVSEDPKYYGQSQWLNTLAYNGERTAYINAGREPRYYAWIGFDRGYYEMMRGDNDRVRLYMRGSEEHGVGNRTRNYSMTGFLQKKCVGPLYCTEQGGMQDNYPWPLMRLADLYLLYAEASFEAGDLETGKTYLNRVRARAGIPSVEESWNGVATLSQDKLIRIVRQERNIEMFSECQYFWDIRRWKEADAVYSQNPQGLNITADDDAGFNKLITIGANWAFTSPTHYLWPIKQTELNINRSLVQNPGY